jgi:hypothetical protein
MSKEDKFIDEIPSRELPLSTVENTPPLMLDLPDGQQLVVGKLPDGIVIEIATWRGTGRPDSRTNRMMLGVSYDEAELEEKPKRAMLKKLKRENEPSLIEMSPVENVVTSTQAPEELLVVTEPEIETVPLPEIIVEDAPILMEAVPTEAIAAPEEATVPVEDVAQVEEVTPAPVIQPAVEPQRNMQDLFGARPRAQLDTQTRTPLIEQGHEIVRKPSKKRTPIKLNIKTLIKPVAAVLLTIFGIYLLVGPGGVRFTLPEGGLRTSLSTAANALVIVRESSNYQIGDSVVAAVLTPEKPDYFASIAAQSDIEFVLTENNLYHSALREDVHGKVLLVMPGVGYLLHKLGL